MMDLTDDFDKRMGLFDAKFKREMKEMRLEFKEAYQIKDIEKMEKDHEHHMAKMEKYSERTDEIGRNKYNRRFLGLDKYGNAIHPRYMKNEKYHANNKKKEPKHIQTSEPTLPKKKSSKYTKLGIISVGSILFYFAYKVISIVLKS